MDWTSGPESYQKIKKWLELWMSYLIEANNWEFQPSVAKFSDC